MSHLHTPFAPTAVQLTPSIDHSNNHGYTGDKVSLSAAARPSRNDYSTNDRHSTDIATLVDTFTLPDEAQKTATTQAENILPMMSFLEPEWRLSSQWPHVTSKGYAVTWCWQSLLKTHDIVVFQDYPKTPTHVHHRGSGSSTIDYILCSVATNIRYVSVNVDSVENTSSRHPISARLVCSVTTTDNTPACYEIPATTGKGATRSFIRTSFWTGFLRWTIMM